MPDLLMSWQGAGQAVILRVARAYGQPDQQTKDEDEGGPERHGTSFPRGVDRSVRLQPDLGSGRPKSGTSLRPLSSA